MLTYVMYRMGESSYRNKLVRMLKTYGVWHPLDLPWLLRRVHTPRGGSISILTRTSVLHLAAQASPAVHRLLVDAHVSTPSELLAALHGDVVVSAAAFKRSPRAVSAAAAKRSPRASGALMTRLYMDPRPVFLAFRHLPAYVR